MDETQKLIKSTIEGVTKKQYGGRSCIRMLQDENYVKDEEQLIYSFFSFLSV